MRLLLDDAKAQANLHGVRITAASVNAARTLLSKMDSWPTPPAAAEPKFAPTRPRRRVRVSEIPFDFEAFVRGVVAKLHNHGNAEAEPLREGIRKAIVALQATLGDR